MYEPKFKTGTKEAIESLAKELNLPYDQSMQDWSYEIANPEYIELYIEHYNKTLDENKKFILMEIILQALNDQIDNKYLLKYWILLKEILIKDFEIHEYTIFYWSCIESQNYEDTWTITPFIKEIWIKYKKY